MYNDSMIHAILITFFDHLYLPVATHGHVASDYKIETRKPYGGCVLAAGPLELTLNRLLGYSYILDHIGLCARGR